MKHSAKAAFLAVALALLFTFQVFAEDYITAVVEALKTTSVYVYPGTPGTDPDTQGKLAKLLIAGDDVVLVMLPSDAATEVDTYSLARSLSDKLGNTKIIGLAVGKDVVGYAPILDSGVAADLMDRAHSVSSDPVTALITFSQNVHKWQQAHPTPVPSILETPKKGGISVGLMLMLALGLVVLVLFLGFLRRRASESPREKSRFDAPDHVRDLMAQIAQLRFEVNDEGLQQVIYQMCLDIEKYFETSTNDPRSDALFFKERLTEIVSVLKKYIDVQDNPRYYYNPGPELRVGKDSITDFGQYVLDSIRRGNRADLIYYKVNTEILKAQKND